MKKNMLAAMMVVSTSFVWAENITVDLTNRNFEIANKDNVSCCAWSSNAEICYENPQNGKACARQKSNGSKWDVIMHTQPFVVEPNTKYRVTVWNRNTLTGGIAKYGIRFVDENMKTMPVKFAGGGYLWRTVKKGETNWTEYKVEFTTPENVAFLNIYFLVDKPQGDVFWDSVNVEKIVPSEGK